jgi:hypothetical protein
LVVLAIIGVLVGLLLPAVQNNLKQKRSLPSCHCRVFVGRSSSV